MIFRPSVSLPCYWLEKNWKVTVNINETKRTYLMTEVTTMDAFVTELKIKKGQ